MTTDGIKLLAERVTTTVILSSHYSLPVAIAATDSDGDSGALSTIVELATPPVGQSNILPDCIAQDVAIVTNSANQQLVLRWRPPLDPSKLQVCLVAMVT